MVPFWDSARKERCSVTALVRQDILEVVITLRLSSSTPRPDQDRAFNIHKAVNKLVHVQREDLNPCPPDYKSVPLATRSRCPPPPPPTPM